MNAQLTIQSAISSSIKLKLRALVQKTSRSATATIDVLLDTLTTKLVLTLMLFLYGASLMQAQEKDVVLHTTSGDLFGTVLNAVQPNGVFALLIAGSGPTDRNGNNMGMTNNSLKMLADSLAKMGVSSLRYDKRGIAKSAGAMKAESELRFDDLLDDATAWIELIRKDFHPAKIAVFGHSEGALIGMIAALRGHADLYISVAGVGEQAHLTIKRQLKSNNASVAAQAEPVLDSLALGKTVTNYPYQLNSIFRPSIQPYLISWFKYDPIVELAKLKIPILVLQGSTDIQVTQDDARALAKANSNAVLALIPGMNHVLKMASALQFENLATYSDPKLSLAPEFVMQIRNFMSAHQH